MTPHLDLTPAPPLVPGTAFQVEVFADQRPSREGETAQPIDLILPPDLLRFTLTTQLQSSDHFKIMGATSRPLRVNAEKQTTGRVRFDLQVRTEGELHRRFRRRADACRGWISATFDYHGRPSGSVLVEPDLAVSGRKDKRTAAPPAGRGAVRVDAYARLPDLVVQIRTLPGSGREFQCRVSTRLVRFKGNKQWVRWTLDSAAEQIVRGFMKGFVSDQLTARGRLGELQGAGVELFKKAPKNFIEAYWTILDKGKALHTIAIVSEEPFIPWELMVPRRGKGTGEVTLPPLGVQCAIGRYTSLDQTSGPQRFRLRRSLVLAPRYLRNALERAEAEAGMVLRMVNGERLDPVLIDPLLDALRRAPPDLVHFVGHGEDDEDRIQSLLFEQDERLRASAVPGHEEIHQAFTKTAPLVMINACEVGRPTVALQGAGGLAQALIDRGAGGVVAALWSVADGPAHEVARIFYQEALRGDPKPFAEILREIRQRAYEGKELGEDTYAAYCFYGDPLAARE
jgi:hypothetical protein